MNYLKKLYSKTFELLISQAKLRRR